MEKLVIEYRTEDRDDNYFKGKTYYSFNNEDKRTVISIAPEEKKKLNEIIYGIEKELQDGFNLRKDENFEIDEADKMIMEYEEEKDCRINGKLYPYLRYIGENKNNYEKLEKLLKIIN